MATKSVTVPIPQSMIDEAAKGEVTKLQRKVKTLEAKVARLEQTHREAKDAVDTFKSLRETVKDLFEIYEDRDW